MNNLIKHNRNYNPSLLGNMFENFFQNSLINDDFWNLGMSAPIHSVPVNIKEKKDSYVLELSAPGLNKDDFKLNISDNMLTISFEKKEEKNESDSRWIHNEFTSRSFTRSFTMDETMNDKEIKAQYLNGVLEVTIPKKEPVQKEIKNIVVE